MPKSADSEGRACLRCAFAVKQQLLGPNGEIQIGQTQLVCKRRSPGVVAIPQGTTITLIPSFPPVTPELWCYDFWPEDEVLPGDVGYLNR